MEAFVRATESLTRFLRSWLETPAATGRTRALVRWSRDPVTALRMVKERTGLKPREIAERIGVTRRAVAYWLAGKQKPTGLGALALHRFLSEELF